MLMPKRTKFRRPHRVSYEGKAKGAKAIDFGQYGLMALEGTWITQNQIEASRIAMTRYMNREGKVWIRIFPHIGFTRKPLATRMGGGKSSVEEWVAPIKKGTVLLEVDNVSKEVAIMALEKAKFKLSVPCFIVQRKFAYL